jgi:hypothetical protein
MVFSSAGFSVYIGPAGGTGERVYFNAGEGTPDAVRFGVYVGVMFDISPNFGSYVIHGFRVRQEEVYTGDTYSAPSVIPSVYV